MGRRTGEPEELRRARATKSNLNGRTIGEQRFQRIDLNHQAATNLYDQLTF